MAMTKATERQLNEAITLTRRGEYLKAYVLFMEVYGGEEAPAGNDPRASTGLSFFGLCVALVQKKYKEAIDLCKKAMQLHFYDGDHHANLARVYMAAGNRKKAVETADAGLKMHPEHGALLEVRKDLGVRGPRAVPFLDRENPINVSLGQARHAKKVAEEERKRKPRGE